MTLTPQTTVAELGSLLVSKSLHLKAYKNPFSDGFRVVLSDPLRAHVGTGPDLVSAIGEAISKVIDTEKGVTQ